jgi:methylmalonyl-CoA mutase, N-terminal domain
MRLVVDTMEFGTRDVPLWNTISISGYHIREAGRHRRAGAGFHPGRRDGPTSRWGIARGLDVDAFAPRLSSSSTPTTISSKRSPSTAPPAASGRARCADLRRARDPRSWLMRFHTQTAGAPSPPSSRKQYRARRHPGAGCGAGGPNRCTPTAWTKPLPCPPSTR